MTFSTKRIRHKAAQLRLVEPDAARMLKEAADEIERLVQEALEQSDIEAHRSHFTKEYNGG